MATLAFQMIGSSLGQTLGGGFGAILGRAAGALAGAAIDRAIMGGSERRVQSGPRLNDLDGISASEGAPVPRAYGRVRLGGQVIWATEFEEETTVERSGGSGGKSTGLRAPQPQQTTIRYVYSANFAIGICEGPVAFIRRIWADGKPLDLAGLNYRIYTGTGFQPADPLIVAKQGTGHVPAFRGLAYIVFERFPLAAYGNRLPQFSFEVVRPLPGLPERLRTVNIIPGSTEFGYATSEIREDFGYGNSRALNRSQWTHPTDWQASIDALQALCPNLQRATLISSWFGDDLRAGVCRLEPRTEKSNKVTTGQDWEVSGLNRATALPVSEYGGRPNYGGTPSDATIIAAIRDLKSRGLKVALHPFILMDIPAGNARPDPHGGASQPPFPWRGRITCDPAPGQPGSVAGNLAANAQIEAFVGMAQSHHFALDGDRVIYSGPEEWSFRRMVLHHAMLAKAAGGVETFFIASELVGLTHVQGNVSGYPMVQALMGMLIELRAILGPSTRITYAADWTEYGAHVLGGGQQVRFPLDPLWSHPEIGAVAIDFYPPVSDWRAGSDHLDAELADHPHDAGYLLDRIGAGEAFDWYYPDATARQLQERQPIADGAYGKPWIYRAKDLVGWWSNAHHERFGGVEMGSSTGWVGASKPILLAEIGCPAVDSGSNQPNVFPDPKSSENALPHFSSGMRDDLIQRRLLEAMLDRFDTGQPGHIGAHNPISPIYGGPMVSPDFIAPWAYDARPFPAFPALTSLWSDGSNWELGHWLNGRLEMAPVTELVRAILRDHRHDLAVTGTVAGAIDGYVIDRPMSARAAIEPLVDGFGLTARVSPVGLELASRSMKPSATIEREDLVLAEKRGAVEIEISRREEVELARSFRFGYFDPDRDFRRAVAEARRERSSAQREVSDEGAMVVAAPMAQAIAERRLVDIWGAREQFRFSLPPSYRLLEAGDLVELETPSGFRRVRLTRVVDARDRVCEAVSFDEASGAVGPPVRLAVPDPLPPPLPGSAFVRFIELPLAHQPEAGPLAALARANPWRPPYSIAEIGAGGTLAGLGEVTQPARVGTLVTSLPAGPLWRWDHAAQFDLVLEAGALSSVSAEAALAGINAVGVTGSDGLTEIVLFKHAELIAARTYRISGLVRGLGLSEKAAGRNVSAGAFCFLLDDAVIDVGLGIDRIGRVVELAVVPFGRDIADPASVRQTQNITGLTYRPLAPVHAKARREAGGVRISFIRRTRAGGDSWDLFEVPLGEDREEYRLEIRQGNTVKREASLSVPEFLYPSSDEMADFGSVQTMISVSIAQVSTRVGPGDALVKTLPIH
ncbi:MAG: glycoside hydrolase/phage tail family protein [Rhizobiales bacterium]|nr:glycoside hydrolase/phage tail family protein [Hyphomicrobiales bacterium]